MSATLTSSAASMGAAPLSKSKACASPPSLCLRRFGLGFFALQQRIALQLGFHEFGEFDVRELQQLDGLLQLRRDHQALALAQL